MVKAPVGLRGKLVFRSDTFLIIIKDILYNYRLKEIFFYPYQLCITLTKDTNILLLQ